MYDIPAGAYIMQSPAGFDTKHDSAVPMAVVPDGQLVAMVMRFSSIAIYPAGHDVDGAVAYATLGAPANKNIIRFIRVPLICQ